MLQGRPLPAVNGVKFPPQLSIYFKPIWNQFVEVILIVQKSHSTTTFLGCINKSNPVNNGDVQLKINLPQLLSELKPEFFRHPSSNSTYNWFLDPPKVGSTATADHPSTQRVAENRDVSQEPAVFTLAFQAPVWIHRFSLLEDTYLWRMGS